MNNDGSPPLIKVIDEYTERDAAGNEVNVLVIDDDTAESFFREDLRLAEQWLADIRTEYATKLMEAEAKVNEYRRDLHEFLAERYDGRTDR